MLNSGGCSREVAGKSSSVQLCGEVLRLLALSKAVLGLR